MQLPVVVSETQGDIKQLLATIRGIQIGRMQLPGTAWKTQVAFRHSQIELRRADGPKAIASARLENSARSERQNYLGSGRSRP